MDVNTYFERWQELRSQFRRGLITFSEFSDQLLGFVVMNQVRWIDIALTPRPGTKDGTYPEKDQMVQITTMQLTGRRQTMIAFYAGDRQWQDLNSRNITNKVLAWAPLNILRAHRRMPEYLRRSDTPIEYLIETLVEIANGEVEVTRQEVDNTYLECDQVTKYAEDALLYTTDRGMVLPNDVNIKYLMARLGEEYRVEVGEQDSTGWVTGVIRTPAGKFVFG